MAEKFDFEEALSSTIRGKLGRIEYLVEGGKGELELERYNTLSAAGSYARDALHLAQAISDDLREIEVAVLYARVFLQALEEYEWPCEDTDSEAGKLKQRLSDNLRRLKRSESLCAAVRCYLGRDIDARSCGLYGYQDDEEEM